MASRDTTSANNIDYVLNKDTYISPDEFDFVSEVAGDKINADFYTWSKRGAGVLTFEYSPQSRSILCYLKKNPSYSLFANGDGHEIKQVVVNLARQGDAPVCDLPTADGYSGILERNWYSDIGYNTKFTVECDYVDGDAGESPGNVFPVYFGGHGRTILVPLSASKVTDSMAVTARGWGCNFAFHPNQTVTGDMYLSDGSVLSSSLSKKQSGVSPAIAEKLVGFIPKENLSTNDSGYTYYVFGTSGDSEDEFATMFRATPVVNNVYAPGAPIPASVELRKFPSDASGYGLISNASGTFLNFDNYNHSNYPVSATDKLNELISGLLSDGSGVVAYGEDGTGSGYVMSPYGYESFPYVGISAGTSITTPQKACGVLALTCPVFVSGGTSGDNGLVIPLCGTGDRMVSAVRVSAEYCPRVAYTPVVAEKREDGWYVTSAYGSDVSSSFVSWIEYGWISSLYEMPMRRVSGVFYPEWIGYTCEVDDFGFDVSLSGYGEDTPFPEAVDISDLVSPGITGFHDDYGRFRISSAFGLEVSAWNSVVYRGAEGGAADSDFNSVVRRRYDYNWSSDTGHDENIGVDEFALQTTEYMPYHRTGNLVLSSIPMAKEFLGTTSGRFYDRRKAEIECTEEQFANVTLNRYEQYPVAGETVRFQNGDFSMDLNGGSVVFIRPLGEGYTDEPFNFGVVSAGEMSEEALEVFTLFLNDGNRSVYISPSGGWMANVVGADDTLYPLEMSVAEVGEQPPTTREATYYGDSVSGYVSAHLVSVGSAVDDWFFMGIDGREDQCECVSVNWVYGSASELSSPLKYAAHKVSANGDLRVYAADGFGGEYWYVGSGNSVEIGQHDYQSEAIFVVPAENGMSVTGLVELPGVPGRSDGWKTGEFLAWPFYVPDRITIEQGPLDFDGRQYDFVLSAENISGEQVVRPHRLHTYRWEILAENTTNLEEWGLAGPNGEILTMGNDTIMGPSDLSVFVIPSGTDNLTTAGGWTVKVRTSLVRDGNVVTGANGALRSEWVELTGVCRYEDFDWAIKCEEQLCSGNMLYFSDPASELTLSATVRRGITPPVMETFQSSALSVLIAGEIEVGRDYPLAFHKRVEAEDGIAPPEWGMNVSVPIYISVIGRYVPELKYIDDVNLSAYPECAFCSANGGFYKNYVDSAAPSAFGNFEIVDNGHRGAFYLSGMSTEIPSGVELVETECSVCKGGSVVRRLGSLVSQTTAIGDSEDSKRKFGSLYCWKPVRGDTSGAYTMRLGLDFSRSGETFAFEEELARSEEFAYVTDLDGSTRERVLYRETKPYSDVSLSGMATEEMSLAPIGPGLLPFSVFAVDWYGKTGVTVKFPVGDIVGDALVEESMDDPDNRLVVHSDAVVGGVSPLNLVWEADYYNCDVESSDGWLYRGFVPGDGRICGLRPTIYVTPLGVVRGTDAEISVNVKKPVMVSMSAHPINAVDDVVSGWVDTSVVVNQVVSRTLHGADSVSFVPDGYVVSITSATNVMWRNMTKPGLYQHYLVDAYGSERVTPLPSGEPYMMSGFGGEGFCRFTASGVVELADSDGRKKTVVTEFDAPNILYVGEFDSEISPPYRSPMSNNIVLDYDENAVTIGPNEFITSELLNSKMDMLQHDLEQVMKSAKLFAVSPYAYVGYLGRGYLRGGNLASYNMWVSLGGGGEHDIASAASSIVDSPFAGSVSFCVNPDESIAYFGEIDGADKYVVCSLGSVPVLASGFYSDVYTEEGFVRPRITSLRLDNDGRLYFVVPDVNRVVCYSKYNDDGNETVRFLYDWGGFGGPDAKLKFNHPLCVAIDEGNADYGQSIYVLDGGNNCVKKYNLSGVWRGTFKYVLGKGETAVWMDVDVEGRIHILTNLRDLILGPDGGVVGEYVLDLPDPVCVFRNRNNNFVYIMFKRNIVKITGEGDFLCRCSDGIGWKVLGAQDGIPEFGGDMRFGYADNHDQLWVLFDGFVVVYSDVVRQIRLYSPEVDKHLWGSGDLHVARGEYVSDMVVNTILQRMYDNVNLVRLAMHSKIDYREKNGITNASIVGLAPVEYRKLNIADKDDVVVPMDAPMTSESFNHCIRMIYSAIETLLSFVQDETVV